MNILSISFPVRGNHETYGDVNTLGPNYAKHWLDNIANVLSQIPRNGPPNEVGMSYSFAITMSASSDWNNLMPPVGTRLTSPGSMSN